MAKIKMKQETAIKHFEPIGTSHDMVNAIKTDPQLREQMAIDQHKTRPDTTALNTTIFIKQNVFDAIVKGTYCAGQMTPVGGEPAEIERYLLNHDILAKVTTKREISGYTVEHDLIGDATGNSVFKCKYDATDDVWLVWHFVN